MAGRRPKTSSVTDVLAQACSPRAAAVLRRVALVTTALSWSVVTIWAAAVNPPAQGRELSHEERLILARSLAHKERGWQRTAEEAFPGDLWSQDDDFFNQEQSQVRELARLFGTTPSAILRGIDELLRSEPGGRKTSVHPCKPRPFYD